MNLFGILIAVVSWSVGVQGLIFNGSSEDNHSLHEKTLPTWPQEDGLTGKHDLWDAEYVNEGAHLSPLDDVEQFEADIQSSETKIDSTSDEVVKEENAVENSMSTIILVAGVPLLSILSIGACCLARRKRNVTVAVSEHEDV